MQKHIFIFFVLIGTSVPLFAAEGSPNWQDLLLKSANFILLLIALHLIASKPIKNLLRGILNKDADDFEAAEAKLLKAKKEYSELQDKMKALEKDLEKMKEASLRDAAKHKEKIIADAKAFAKRLAEQTETKIKQREQQAIREIKETILKESLKLSAQTENLNKIDSSKLLNGFNQQLSEVAR